MYTFFYNKKLVSDAQLLSQYLRKTSQKDEETLKTQNANYVPRLIPASFNDLYIRKIQDSKSLYQYKIEITEFEKAINGFFWGKLLVIVAQTPKFDIQNQIPFDKWEINLTEHQFKSLMKGINASIKEKQTSELHSPLLPRNRGYSFEVNSSHADGYSAAKCCCRIM